MPTNTEVFAWPECSIYITPSGQSALTALSYADSVAVNVEWSYLKFKHQGTGSFAARTKFSLADKDVTLSFGQLHYANSAFLQANSATAFDARIVFDRGFTSYLLNEDASYLLLEDSGKLILDEAYTGFKVESGVFTRWGLQGQEGGLFHSTIEMRAADISGF